MVTLQPFLMKIRITNIYLSHHEENWLNESPVEFKLSFLQNVCECSTLLISLLIHWNFVDPCSKSFLNELYTPKVIVQNSPKKDAFITLLVVRTTSFLIWKKLQELFTDNLMSFSPFFPNASLSTPWKHSKTVRFSDVFRG